MFIMVEAIVHLPNSRGNDRNWWNYQCNSSILDKFMTNRVDDCTRFVKMDIVKNSYKVRKKRVNNMSKQFNDTIIRAYKGEQTDYTPTWYMRQAGRSQPEYLKLKEKYSLFEITHQPELGAYVTRLPVENYDLDAAILYKDIMTPLPAM